MKSFTKICLFLSAALAVLGVAGIGVSLAMGLKTEQLLNLAHYPNKLIKQEIHTYSDIKPVSPAGEYMEFRNVDEIRLDLSVCELQLAGHAEDYISLEVENAGSTFQCEKDGNKLVIKDDRNGGDILASAGRGDASLLLTLYLPDKELALLDLSLGVGEVYADALKIKRGKLEIGVGDISINYFDGQELEIDCGTGNISVTAIGSDTDYSYDLDCDMGTITINQKSAETYGHHTHEETHEGLDNHVESDHDAGRKLEMDCGIGDIELNFEEE